MMSCSGQGWSMSILGDCSMAWISFAIVLFLVMIARRQCTDGILAGTGFNTIGAFVLGLGLNILTISIFGSARWGLLAGVLGVAIGGYVLGMFFGGENE